MTREFHSAFAVDSPRSACGIAHALSLAKIQSHRLSHGQGLQHVVEFFVAADLAVHVHRSFSEFRYFVLSTLLV